MPDYLDVDDFVKQYEYSEQDVEEYSDYEIDNLTEGDEQ